MENVISSFDGEFFFLSNFYNCEVPYENLVYKNAEAAFHSAKNNNEYYKKRLAQYSAKQAKAAGRKILLRIDWEQVKDKIMYDVVKSKFTHNQNLKNKLLATGNVTLVEGNTWGDTYWGQCYGKGKNKLGQILERVRGELRSS